MDNLELLSSDFLVEVFDKDSSLVIVAEFVCFEKLVGALKVLGFFIGEEAVKGVRVFRSFCKAQNVSSSAQDSFILRFRQSWELLTTVG